MDTIIYITSLHHKLNILIRLVNYLNAFHYRPEESVRDQGAERSISKYLLIYQSPWMKVLTEVIGVTS